MTTHMKYAPQQTFSKYSQTGEANQLTSNGFTAAFERGTGNLTERVDSDSA